MFHATTARRLCAVAIAFGTLATSACYGQGIALNSIGAINQSMGGAAVAAPLDAVGALHWNPATISGLPQSEVSLGSLLALSTQRVSSNVGPFFGDTTEGEPGASPIPYMGFVEHVCDTPWTYGLGIYGVAGFRTNYPISATNPALTPQPPLGVGIGRAFSEAEIIQMAPTVSYAVTERLSVGVAPTISMAKIAIDPLLLATPDDANGDNIYTYPSGRGSRYLWGGGFQIGAYYIASETCRVGASFKSPQWIEPLRFKTTNELGQDQLVKRSFVYPLIVSLGASYQATERAIIALDVRYMDYGNSAGFGPGGYADDGALAGLGWSSVMSVATGVQLELTPRCYLRFGYCFNQNPISDSESSLNVLSPVIMQHFVGVGGSWYATDRLAFSLTYGHGFENSVEGPILTPLGPVPNSSIRNELTINGVSFGITFRH